MFVLFLGLRPTLIRQILKRTSKRLSIKVIQPIHSVIQIIQFHFVRHGISFILWSNTCETWRHSIIVSMIGYLITAYARLCPDIISMCPSCVLSNVHDKIWYIRSLSHNFQTEPSCSLFPNSSLGTHIRKAPLCSQL